MPETLASAVLPVAGVAILALLLLLLSAALDSSGPIRLRHWAEEAGGRLRKLHENRPRFHAFRFCLHVASHCGIVLLFLVLTLQAPLGAALPLGVALAMVAGFLLVGDYLARVLVLWDAERTLSWLTRFYRLVSFAVFPLVWLMSGRFAAVAAVKSEDEEDEASEGEIEAFLHVGAQEGILEPGEQVLIQRVIDFHDTRVKSVMTPRTEMAVAAADTGLEELTRLFLDSNHSRIPLFHESVDQIAGILHIRDLLAAVRAGGDAAPAKIALPAYFVPQSKPLDELLREFQAKGLQMAIVVDEYGGTAGLVTVEDLLEEIVGEILDEHEDVEVLSEPLGEGQWRLEGRAPLVVLSELFDVVVPAGPYETVGGFLFDLIGSVPDLGRELEAQGLKFTVEKVEERRIQTVRVARATAQKGGGA